MKNLKNWLNKNNFSFEVQKNMLGEEIIFVKVQGLGSENTKKIKTYLKRYKFNFEYRCNYTYILAKKEEEKIYKTIDNSIVQAATKENKINDLLVDNDIIRKANKLIEAIEPIKEETEIKENLNNICKDGEVMKSKTVKQSRVNGALERYNLGIKRSEHFYNSIDEQIEKYKNTNNHLYDYYINKKEEYKKDLEKSILDKENFIKNILPKYTIVSDVKPIEPIKEEFYNTCEIKEEEKMQTLEKYINDNIDKNDKFYNESFCNIVYDYIGSYGLTLNDVYFLHKNNYDMYDFLEEETHEELIQYLENEINKDKFNKLC